MARTVRDFVQIDRFSTLDDLIHELIVVRDSLPAGSDAEVVLRGDQVFGRHIAVAYKRAQTVEEAECEARYADASRRIAERQERERGPHAPWKFRVAA